MKDKWQENVFEFFLHGNAGKCPECGAQVIVEKYETPYRDSYMFRCTQCKAGAHFDGACKNG